MTTDLPTTKKHENAVKDMAQSIIDSNEKYRKAIKMMAQSMDLNGELPNMYSDEFKSAVCALLSKEKLEMKVVGSLAFNSLLNCYSANNEKVFDLVSKYIRKDEEDESLSETSIKIADLIMQNALIYYRDNIERDVLDKYNKEYCNDLTFGSFDQLPHGI